MPLPRLLAIEIGGTKLQAALGDPSGTIHQRASQRVEAAAGAEAVRSQLIELFDEMLVNQAPPDAVCAGFGGPIDWRSGTILHSHQVSGWGGFPLASWLREKLACDHIVVANDSDTAALGEARFGAGVGASPLLYVNSGSGVGGGLVVDGQIYRGGPHGALEIGHLPLRTREDQSPVTLEQLASGWAIGTAARQAVERSVHSSPGPLRELARERGAIDAQIVAEAAGLGDVDALAILDAATDAMAQALAIAVTLLGPKRIVLGGGVAQMGETLWIDPIRRKLAAVSYPMFRGTFEVVGAMFGQDVVLVGGFALAADCFTY